MTFPTAQPRFYLTPTTTKPLYTVTLVLSTLAYPHHDKNFCHGHGHRGPIRHARWLPRHSVHDLDRKRTHRLPGHSARAGPVVHRFLLYANRYIRRSPRRVRFSSPDIISSDRQRWVHSPFSPDIISSDCLCCSTLLLLSDVVSPGTT